VRQDTEMSTSFRHPQFAALDSRTFNRSITMYFDYNLFYTIFLFHNYFFTTVFIFQLIFLQVRQDREMSP
jgi:hypothetical protein